MPQRLISMLGLLIIMSAELQVKVGENRQIIIVNCRCRHFEKITYISIARINLTGSYSAS